MRHFNQTDKGIDFARKSLRDAKLSGLIYGPVTLAFLTFSAWVKLGRTPIINYAYAITFIVVLFIYYINNIIRRGIFFNSVIDNVWISDGKLVYTTNQWICMKSKTGELSMANIALAKKTIMGLNTIQLSSDKVLYIIKDSLFSEKDLIMLIEQSKIKK